MNSTRRRWLGGIGLLGLVMLFSHQNCSPMNSSATSASGEGASPSLVQAPEAPLPVTVIDDSKSGANLSFQYPSVQIASDAQSMDIVGNCDPSQEGVTLGWTISLLTATGAVSTDVVDGQSGCSSGAFHVSLDNVQTQFQCGSSYQITAKLGFGTPGVTVVTRACAASASN